MSGSAKNLQRDGTWVTPDTSANLALSTGVISNSAQIYGNSDGTAKVDKADAQTRDIVTLTQDWLYSFGVLIQEPQGDNTPYRVKADGMISGISGTINNPMLVVGYAPASPTGSDDVIDQPYFIPFNQGEFDDVIIVPKLLDADPNFGRALYIGVVFCPGTTVSSLPAIGHISVQNLGIKPPTMHWAVS